LQSIFLKKSKINGYLIYYLYGLVYIDLASKGSWEPEKDSKKEDDRKFTAIMCMSKGGKHRKKKKIKKKKKKKKIKIKIKIN